MHAGIIASLTLIGFVSAAPAAAAPVFACSLGAKSVSVTQLGRQLTYRFGAPGKTDLTITVTPHYRSDRYAAIEQQLRFTKGPYSYIVYSMDANAQAGSNAVSGLVVMNGAKKVADMSCKHYASFAGSPALIDLFQALPQDGEAFSAM